VLLKYFSNASSSSTAVLGIDIWTVFLSFNTFFLGFSFLFGSGKCKILGHYQRVFVYFKPSNNLPSYPSFTAASNYFEGLLLIFVRRPYGA